MQKIFIKTNKRQKMLPAFFVALAFVLTSIFPSFNFTEAAFNKEINYQGKLTTANSIAVADGAYNMEFKLYTSGGTTLWTETRTGVDRVPVSSGLFSVMLGELSSLSTVDFNQTLYLGVNIGGTSSTPAWDGEMTPRKKLGVVPAAIESERAVTATKSTNLIGGNSTSLFGAVPYQSDTDTTSFVSPNVTLTKKFFSMTGTGTNGAVPLWEALVAGDVGLGNVTNESKATMFTAPTFTGSTLITGDLTVADATNTVRTFLKPINDSGAVGTSSNHPLGFYTNNSQVATLLTNGNFGIGTTTPNNLFQVAGLINFNDTDFNTSIGKNAGLNIIAGAGYNSFVGYEAGKGGASGTNAADNNSALGYQAFYSNKGGYNNTASGTKALYSNTYGNYNTASGMQSLQGNTTGSWNTASGYQALYTGQAGSGNTADGYVSLYMNAGDNNTASGYASLYFNTTGYGNTATGYRAISSNTTGYNNTAIGMNAGRYITGGTVSNLTSNNSVYVGYNSMAGADGRTNEIVIGANAVGNGSDSVTLGNTSVTKTILQGSVGVGTTTPGFKLHVSGAFGTGVAAGFKVENTDIDRSFRIGWGASYPRLIGNVGLGFVGAGDYDRDDMFIDTVGNVGIGTTVPSTKLDVYAGADASQILWGQTIRNEANEALTGYGSGLKLKISSNTTGEVNKWAGIAAVAGANYANMVDVAFYGSTGAAVPTELMRIQGGGNVGIGMMAPWAGLSILGKGDSVPTVGIGQSDYGWNMYERVSNGDLLIKANNNYVLTDVLTLNRSNGNVGIGTTTPNEILSIKNPLTTTGGTYPIIISQWGTSSVGGLYSTYDHLNSDALGAGLAFKIYQRNVGLTEAMRINGETGNVGIGTTAPFTKLTIPNASATGGGYLGFEYSDGANSRRWWMSPDALAFGDFALMTESSKGLSSPDLTRFYINNLGNVGIGTTAPGAYKLNVAGDVYSSGGISYAGEIYKGDTTGYLIAVNDGTNNGLYWDTVNSILSMYVNSGSGGISINDTGNVGIGTTAPGAKLEIVNSYSTGIGLQLDGTAYGGSKWAFGDGMTTNGTFSIKDITNSAERFSINSSGNVGIGTTNPVSVLDIGGNGTAYYNISYSPPITADAKVLNIKNTTQSAINLISDTDTDQATIGGIYFTRSLGSADAHRHAAYILGIQDSQSGSVPSVRGGSLTFNVHGSSVPFEAMRVAHTGNVGIGTTTPDYKLVVGDGTGGFRFNVANSSIGSSYGDGGHVQIVGGIPDGTNMGGQIFVGGNGRGDNNKSAITFISNGTEYMRVDGDYSGHTSGNVGIGTTDPSNKLFVKSNTDLDGITILNSVQSPALRLNSSHAYVDSRNWGIMTNWSVYGDFSIHQGSSNGADAFGGTSRLYIKNNGYVGIGTTSPGSKLDVTGNINATGVIAATLWSSADIRKLNVSQALTFRNSGGTPEMTIDGTGNVGIGTTAPLAKLELGGDTTTHGIRVSYTGGAVGGYYGALMQVFRGSGQGFRYDFNIKDLDNAYDGTAMSILPTGNVGIGTTDPGAKLEVSSVGAGYSGTPTLLIKDTSGRATLTMQSLASENTPTDIFTKIGTKWAWSQSVRGDNENRAMQFFGADDAGTGWNSAGVVMTLTRNGNVGIGTTTPGNILTIQQTSATDPIADAWTTYSSGRWKEHREPIVNALEKINELNPVYFDWTADHGGAHDLGFIAEEVGLIIPEVVAWEDNGIDAKSIDYARLSTVAIAGIKEMSLNIGAITGTIIPTPGSQEEIFANNFFDNVFAKVGSWLGDIDNGLEKIFVKEIRTKKLCVLNEEGIETCVIKSQLDALLASAGESGAGSGDDGLADGDEAPFNPKAPVVSLNGDAVINLIKGDTYEEQGVTVTDDVDTDLVATISGAVDTSVVGSYTLSYIVTDTEGYTSIPVTRTVNVAEPAAPASSSTPSAPEADTNTPPSPSETTSDDLSGGTDTSTSSGTTTAGDSASTTPSGDAATTGS